MENSDNNNPFVKVPEDPFDFSVQHAKALTSEALTVKNSEAWSRYGKTIIEEIKRKSRCGKLMCFIAIDHDSVEILRLHFQHKGFQVNVFERPGESVIILDWSSNLE